tara:strand:- start:267 stop:566 length:300 start_codon:yes stop_codon:yes gene_type:complete
VNIKALAKQAGFIVDNDSEKYQTQCIQATHSLIDEPLAEFAELVAAHEREECAKVCEKQIEKENLLQTGDTQTLSNLLIGHRVTAHMTDARLIRARSKA